MHTHAAFLVLALSLGPLSLAAADGLVLYYTFDEGPNDIIKDYSSAGNHGKNIGAEYVQIEGHAGYCLAFNTADAYVDCGNDPSLDLTDALTVELWFKPLTAIEKNEAGIAGKNLESFLISCAGNCWAYLTTEGSGPRTNLTMPPDIGAWQHIALTFDGKEMSLYKDGIPITASHTPGAKIKSASAHFLLRHPVVWGDKVYPTFKCMMDDVRVYNRALSNDEILGHFRLEAASKQKDTTWFGKPRLIPHVFPLVSTLLVEADLLRLKPVPSGTRLQLDLRDAQQNKVVRTGTLLDIGKTRRVEYVPSPMVCYSTTVPIEHKVEWSVDIGDLPAGRYELSASARDDEDRPVGHPSTVQVILPGTPVWRSANPDVKVLNNLVIQLLDVRSPRKASQLVYTIDNPREGWLFIALTASGDVAVTLDGAEAKDAVLRAAENPGNAETMQYLSEGRHTLALSCSDDASVEWLVVRAVPELCFPCIGCRPCPWLRSYGPYDWDYFAKNGILGNFNTVIVHADLPEEKTYIASWKKSGRKVLACGSQACLRLSHGPFDPETSYRTIAQSEGFTRPDRDGIIIDEFDNASMPPNQADYVPLADVIRRIARNEQFKGRKFYAYGKRMVGQYPETFVRALVDAGDVLAEELYLQEQPTEKMAKESFDVRMRDVMLRYRELYGDFQNHTMAVFGYFSIPKETLNVNPNVNWKVFQDMMMNCLANDPVFSGLYGLEVYHPSYMDEETLRWSAKLVRHYCIEGKRDRLTRDPYVLSHIENADFAEGLRGWTVDPAEKDSIFLGSKPHYSWMQGRYPRTPQGDTFLVTRRSAAKPNRFSQPIKNLDPARLYSMKMLTADYDDLSAGKSEEKTPQVSVRIDNVDLVPERSICEPITIIHDYGPFTRKNLLWITYRVVFFRPKAPEATLIISDWKTDTEPGGPVGQQLIHNFIEVEPYFEQ
ncbi:MAG: LamG domain-containing protein [Planctomycetota bacterium]